MDARELWLAGRFDEAIAAATALGTATAVGFATQAVERLRFLNQHGIPVAVRMARDFHEIELFVGGAGLKFVDGCPFNDDQMRPYLCDLRTQDAEPFLAALSRAGALELSPPTAGKRCPVACSITVWSGADIHPKAHRIRISLDGGPELVCCFIDDAFRVGVLMNCEAALSRTLPELAVCLRGEADVAIEEPSAYDLIEAWGAEYPRIVGDGICAMRDGVLVYSADASPRVVPIALDVTLVERTYKTCDGNLFAPQLLAQRPSGALCIVDLRAEPRAIDLPASVDPGATAYWDPSAPLVALSAEDTHIVDTDTGELRATISGHPIHWEKEGLLCETAGAREQLHWWRRDGRVEPTTWDGFRSRDGTARLPLTWDDVMYPGVPATSRSRWFGATGYVQKHGPGHREFVTDASTGISRFLFDDPRLRIVEVSASGAFSVAREHRYSWAHYVVARRRPTTFS